MRAAQLVNLVLLTAALLWPGADTQAEPRALDRLSIKTWNVDHGLPHNSVLGIVQDPRGFLWVGTWEGLVRFDGREFQRPHGDAHDALSGQGITAMRSGRDGWPLIGTHRGGIWRLGEDGWTVILPARGPIADQIQDLAEDQDGVIWVATDSRNLIAVHADRIEHFGTAHGIPSGSLYALAIDRDRRLMIGSREGLLQREGDRFVTSEAAEIGKRPIFGLLADPEGGVWTGSYEGVRHVPSGRLLEMGGALASRLMFDQHGGLWAGTSAEGVRRIRDGRSEGLDSANGLPNDRIRSVFEDREGNIWLGSNGGLTRLQETPLWSLTAAQGLRDEYIRTVLPRRDGSLLIGHGDGVDELRDGRVRAWQADAEFGGVLSLSEGRDGSIWVGTLARGLVRVQGEQLSWISAEAEVLGSQVRAITEDSSGALWFGTEHGLYRWQDGRVDPIQPDDDVDLSTVLALHQDQRGRLWVGSSTGLALRSGARLESVREFSELGGTNALGILEDPDGTIWIASDIGLMRWRNERATLLGRSRGLPTDTVFAVLGDAHDGLWLTSNVGVLRLSRAEVESALDGHGLRVNVEVFDRDEGMASSQCNGASQPSASRDADGRLWFSTAGGVSTVDPARLGLASGAPLSPQVILESISIDGVRQPALRDLHLGPEQRRLDVHFSGLSLSLPQRVLHRWRLDGLDQDWVNNEGHIALAGLRAGDYRLRMQASLDGRYWVDAPALDIRVTAALLERPELWALLAALTLAGSTLLAAWRVRSAQQREQKLQQQVQTRTRELATQQQLVELANSEKQALLEKLESRAENHSGSAMEDPLTGLANRRRFDRALDVEFFAARAAGQSLALVVAEIDQFQNFHAPHAQAAGDELLRRFARLILRVLRPSDLCARYGGEEFVVLLSHSDAAGGARWCERLQALVAAEDWRDIAPDNTPDDGLEPAIKASFGLADSSEAGDPEDLYQRALARVGAARQQGGGKVVFED